MKIYCEKCNGHGNHGYVMEFEGDEGYVIKCVDCDGKGYTENEELEWFAEIGRATELALVDGVMLTNPNNYAHEYFIGSGSLITDVEELFEWAKEQIK